MKKQERTFPIFEIVLGLFILSGAVLLLLLKVLDNSGKSRTSEAKQTLGALGRGQQAHHVENQTFADDFATLDLGLDEETNNYHYSMENHGDHVFHFAEAKKAWKDHVFLITNIFGDVPLLGGEKRKTHYISAVFATKDGETKVTKIIICEFVVQANIPNFSFSNLLPSLENNVPTCHPDTEEL